MPLVADIQCIAPVVGASLASIVRALGNIGNEERIFGMVVDCARDKTFRSALAPTPDRAGKDLQESMVNRRRRLLGIRRSFDV